MLYLLFTLTFQFQYNITDLCFCCASTQLFSCSYPFRNFIWDGVPFIYTHTCVSIRGYRMWLLRDILLAKGLITSPNGNQVEWMCNGKKSIFHFRCVETPYCPYQNGITISFYQWLYQTIVFPCFLYYDTFLYAIITFPWTENIISKSINETLNFDYLFHRILLNGSWPGSWDYTHRKVVPLKSNKRINWNFVPLIKKKGNGKKTLKSEWTIPFDVLNWLPLSPETKRQVFNPLRAPSISIYKLEPLS